jgi:hypothetical protein
MFANFELSRGGLVAADVKPKRTRTDLGCLPCMYSPITLHNPTGLFGPVLCIVGLYYSDTSSQLTPIIIRSAKEEEM